MRSASSRFWLVVAAVGVVADFGSAALFCQAQESLPDRTAVISAVREYVSSIQSIHVRYDFWQKGVLTAKHMGVTPETEVGPVSFEWAEQGRQKLVRTKVESPGARGMPTIFNSHDGQVAYQVSYERSDATKIQNIRRTPEHHSDILTRVILRDVCGLRVPSFQGTLSELLSLDSAKIVGNDELFSARCVHVRVSEAGVPGKTQVVIDVWLDLQHEFLPRRFVIKVTDDSSGVQPQNRITESTYEVSELMSVRDELLGRTRPFPRVIAATGKIGTTRVIVESVALNRSLPKTLFQPLMPNGTVIIEGEDLPLMAPAKTFVVGGNTAATALVDQRLREATNLPAPQRQLAEAPDGYVDANAAHGWNLGLIIGGVCLAIMGIVCLRNVWFRG